MSAIRRFFHRLVSSFRSNRSERELAREVETHLQLLEDSFIARGMSADEARYAARRAFGGVEQAKERQRDARSFPWIHGASLDLRLGVRMLVKYPGLTLVGGAALTIAIAVGASAFAFLYASVHPTLPLDEGDRVVGVENIDTAWRNQEDRVLHDFVEWRRDVKSIQDLAAVQIVARNLIGADAHPENVSVAEITASAFRVARVPPLLGRSLIDEDEHTGAEPVMVLGHDLWRRWFASDPQIVGRAVRLGGSSYTVVGVMPQGFTFPLNNQVWIPLRENRADYPPRRGPSLVLFGRLAPGVSIETARAELAAAGRRSAAAHPKTHARLQPRIVRYTELWFDDEPRSLIHVVQLMVSLLVVVVGANVAILVYARTATRQAEIVVRTALGASRRRIICQLFIEALVLSALSALAGVAIARLALSQARSAAEVVAARYGGLPFWMQFDLSWGAWIYVAALAVVAALVAGVIPALKHTGRRLATLGQIGAGSTARLGGVWTGLVVAQVAVAVAALPAAVFLTLQSADLANADPGFKADAFLVARVDMDDEAPPPARATAYWEDFERRYATRFTELVERLEAEPEVRDVTTMSMEPGVESIRLAQVDAAVPGERDSQQVRHVRVGTDFFEAFDVSLLAGRLLLAADLPEPRRQNTESHAVVVNRTFAIRFFGGANPLGRRVRYLGEDSARQKNHWHEIVGVVGDLPVSPLSPDGVQSRVYHAVAPGAERWMKLAIRLDRRSPDQFATRLRQIAASIDPAIQLSRMRPLPEVYREEQMWLRWGAVGLMLVTASVLVLSAAGIYALMSVAVSRRSREIGIRVALGADRSRILRSIFSRAVAQLALGVAAGIIAAALMAGAIGGDRTRWTIVLLAVPLFMAIVGLLAALGPARRGLAINPIEALKAE